MPRKPYVRSERALIVPARPVQGAIIEWLNGRGDRRVKTLSLDAHVGPGTISALIQGNTTTITVASARKLLAAVERLDVLAALLPDAKPVVPARNGEEWVPASVLAEVLRDRYLSRPGKSLHTLAQDTGIAAQTMSSWLDGKTGYVRFTVADRVLTKSGLIDAWHTSALRRYYGRDEEAA